MVFFLSQKLIKFEFKYPVEPELNPSSSSIRSVGVEWLSLSITFTCFFAVMERNVENFELLKDNVTMKGTMGVTKTGQGKKSNKCNRCDYVCTDSLRRHLKTYTGEKSKKCNQCDYVTDYVSSVAGDLRTHLKTHSGEMSKKCK